jgi:hypothetical protein
MKSLGRDRRMIAWPHLALRFGDGGGGARIRRSEVECEICSSSGRRRQGRHCLEGNDLLWVASKLGFGVVRGVDQW